MTDSLTPAQMATQTFEGRPAGDRLLDALGSSAAPALALALLEASDAGEQLIAVKDIDTWRYLYVNERMAAFLGSSVNEVLGRTDGELVDSTRAAPLRAADQAAAVQEIALKSDHRVELGGVRRDFVATRLAILPRDGSRPRQLLSLWTETTLVRHQQSQLRAALDQIEVDQQVQVELRKELRDQSLKDSATGLYHHGHFQDQLRREMDLSAREHREFSLVSIALDPLGEQVLAAGDEGRVRVLEALGRLLRGNTRAMDASCWLDEEHFAVLLSGVGLATAHSRMDGLRRQCSAQIVVQGGSELRFSVSMGVASFPHTASNQEDLIRAADQALAVARNRGNYVSLASITLG